MSKAISSDSLSHILARLKANFARLSHTHAADDVTSGTFDAGLLPPASADAQGAMSAAHYTKLEGIAAGANAYTHPTYTARTGKPTSNQTPAFGATFTISQITSDGTGHVTGATDRTVKIPNTAASSSGAGLMSSAHYTKLEALPDNATLASTYALKTDITSMYKHKGSVANVASLPSSDNTVGDVYNVTATGMNYVWTGDEWDALGEVFSIEYMTNAEIDTVFTNAGLTVS